MARPREIDERKHPEQSERIKRAMRLAGVASASDLHELLDWKVSKRTLTSRVEGDTELNDLERPRLATVLGVDEKYLTPGGPELPDLEHFHATATVTGTPHNWVIVVRHPDGASEIIRSNASEIDLAAILAPVANLEATGDRVPPVRPKSKSKEESA